MQRRVLLKWGGAHFVLRLASATLSLRLLHVDGDSKTVEVLEFAQLPVKAEGLEPLPSDARLVAAKEVENEELGICMPILVFQANSSVVSASDQYQQSSVQKKRRRQSGASSSSSLYFFVLTKATAAGSTSALQFINRVDMQVETQQPASSQGDLVVDESNLHVQITDGPHVVVHQTIAQELSILKLGRQDARFYMWRTGVKLQAPAEAPSELRSCVVVGEETSDSPHLLLQFAAARTRDDFNRARGCRWMTCRLSEATTMNDMLTTCSYVPIPSSEVSGTTSDEQVTCCAMLNRGAQAWSRGSLLEMWHTNLASPAGVSLHQPIDVAQGTLVITGTTRNTLYVYDCGVLLLSFVLPTTPCEITQIDGGDENDTFYLAVQCCDVNRSFFLLSFNPIAFQPSMSIVQAFSHVGDALVGDFTAQRSTDEILLINHIDEHEVEVETQANDHLLVKKSVLICKKHAADKHSIHRLRVEEPFSKDKARGSKRNRYSREKEESAAVRYIERIKFGSKQLRTSDRGRNGDEGGGDDDARSSHLVSQSQLVQLTKSLEKRLENGIRELDRLKLIVADKRDAVHRLNHFVEDEWWRSQQNEDGTTGRLPVVAVYDGVQRESRRGYGTEIVMQTLVSAFEETPRAEKGLSLSPAAYSLTTLVSMEDCRVVDFLPSASLFRLVVMLRNGSTHSLRNAYISLVSEATSANGPSSGMVPGIQSSSSVLLNFSPATEKSEEGVGTFVLDARLPPTFAMLRSQQAVTASIWLHYDNRPESEASSLESIACSLLVGSVEISPHDFSQGSDHCQRSSRSVAKEVEKLLLVSSGSSLSHIFQNKEHQRPPMKLLQTQEIVAPELIRPSFALVNLFIRDRELSKYNLGQLVASLPSDVYTMLHPLQEPHLRQVAALLQSIRMEMVVIQMRSVEAVNQGSRDDEDAMSVDDNDTSMTTQQQWRLLTDFRQMQQSTDLSAAKLLHDLQKRANFHSMWQAASLL